jgi:hypothetical protein
VQLVVLVLAALLLGAGCSCDWCDERNGAYALSLDETGWFHGCVGKPTLSGDEVAIPRPSRPGCEGGPVVDSSNCKVVIDLQCNGYGERWEVDWSCDGETGEGTVFVSESSCLLGAEYDVTLEKLE